MKRNNPKLIDQSLDLLILQNNLVSVIFVAQNVPTFS